MEIKTKYQYTYFIYPYIVEEKKYEKHLYKLLKNRNCKIKEFNSKNDSNIYNFFLPKVRDYMFWSLGVNKVKTKKISEFDKKMQSVLLNKYPCTIFEYNINKNIQGKTGKGDGIFFNIRKVEIICFKPGICFILIKTMLDENSTLQNLCDFNYAFRDINSTDNSKIENIKIQTDVFQDVKGIQSFIKDITGNNRGARELNIDTARFTTYSYACVDKKYFESKEDIQEVEKEFNKYANIESSKDSSNINKTVSFELKKNTKLGFINNGTVLLTSDDETENYTKLSEKYENEYLYSYIYELYKKYYLKKLNLEFKIGNKFERTRAKFIKFTQNLMIEETTDDNIGSEIINCWEEVININNVFEKTKQKYDLLYKNVNIEKTARSNKIIMIVLILLVIVNIINSVNLHK